MHRLVTIIYIIAALLFSGSFVGYIVTDIGTPFNNACLWIFSIFFMCFMAIMCLYAFEMTANKERQ